MIKWPNFSNTIAIFKNHKTVRVGSIQTLSSSIGEGFWLWQGQNVWFIMKNHKKHTNRVMGRTGDEQINKHNHISSQL